jgi:hypothetical protein
MRMLGLATSFVVKVKSSPGISAHRCHEGHRGSQAAYLPMTGTTRLGGDDTGEVNQMELVGPGAQQRDLRSCREV